MTARFPPFLPLLLRLFNYHGNRWCASSHRDAPSQNNGVQRICAPTCAQTEPTCVLCGRTPLTEWHDPMSKHGSERRDRARTCESEREKCARCGWGGRLIWWRCRWRVWQWSRIRWRLHISQHRPTRLCTTICWASTCTLGNRQAASGSVWNIQNYKIAIRLLWEHSTHTKHFVGAIYHFCFIYWFSLVWLYFDYNI